MNNSRLDQDRENSPSAQPRECSEDAPSRTCSLESSRCRNCSDLVNVLSESRAHIDRLESEFAELQKLVGEYELPETTQFKSSVGMG
jgi:hypothetical protein